MHPNEPLRFNLMFEPLRPISATATLIIQKLSGGRWSYNINLTASEPEVDDVIKIEALIHRTSSVCFSLTNNFPHPAPFTAFCTADSPFEFTVHPKSGILEPFGSEG